MTMTKKKNSDVAAALSSLLGAGTAQTTKKAAETKALPEGGAEPDLETVELVKIGSTVNAALWRRVKIECAASGVSMRALLEQALRAELDRRGAEA